MQVYIKPLAVFVLSLICFHEAVSGEAKAESEVPFTQQFDSTEKTTIDPAYIETTRPKKHERGGCKTGPYKDQSMFCTALGNSAHTARETEHTGMSATRIAARHKAHPQAQAAVMVATAEDTSKQTSSDAVKPDLSVSKPPLVKVAARSILPVSKAAACSEKMDSCYDSCRKQGGLTDLCNRICTTDVLCSAPMRLTYGQFLDFQVEMIATQ